jgi:predicted metal-dependent peptidase
VNTLQDAKNVILQEHRAGRSSRDTKNTVFIDVESSEPSQTDPSATEGSPETPVPNLERQISASLLRLRMRSPFFATLALFASFKATLELPTAATDGRDVLYNPHFMGKLPQTHFDAVMLHEVLHAALLHVPRRGHRDPEGWNIAADIVVNGILNQNGFELPEGTIRDENLEKYSVEEVYALLPRQEREYSLQMQDLLEEPGDGDSGDQKPGKPKDALKDGQGREADGSLRQARRAKLESHWRQAAQQASVIARGINQGKLPAGAERLLSATGPARLDWRTLLWRYLTRTPTDFEEFDRRMVGRGLYVESLEGQSLRVHVAIDTSGSVDDAQVQAFNSELRGILRAYPHVRCDLYYADATVYGPYTLTGDGEIPPPQGGGGTDFRPFFEAVSQRLEPHTSSLTVYLTDGYGDFPAEALAVPTLWVVTPGGLEADGFPFGEVVKLVD